jgi:hypothetical protein
VHGEIYLPWGIEMNTVSGYASYERLIDIDIDFSPSVLANAVVPDDLYQLTQDVKLDGDLGSFDPATWGLGGYFLYEDLNVKQEVTLRQDVAALLISGRDYGQQIRSFGVLRGVRARHLERLHARWRRALELGEQGAADEVLVGRVLRPGARDAQAFYFNPDDTWQAPTGTLRLAYHLRRTRACTGSTRAAGRRATTTRRRRRSETGLDGQARADRRVRDRPRRRWFTRTLTANAALFYYTYDRLSAVHDRGRLRHAARVRGALGRHAEVYGGELDVVARPWAGAFSRCAAAGSRAASWTSSRSRSSASGSATGGHADPRDRQHRQPAAQLAAVQGQRHRRAGDPARQVRRVIPRYDGVWTSENFFDSTEGAASRAPTAVPGPQHTFSQEAYWLHNVRLSYAPPSQNPMISFWVRNLEDKAYRTLGVDATTFLGTHAALHRRPAHLRRRTSCSTSESGTA